jgi:peptidylprolyl isomerase
MKDGVPAAFDFSGSPKTPSDQLQVITLIKGTGTKIAKGDTAQLDYLGQIYGSNKPFEETYSAEPLVKPIGEEQVIKGWDQGLVGVPVGSRVILVIPPDLAYGKAGQGDIPGDATLTFLVDVLAAY